MSNLVMLSYQAMEFFAQQRWTWLDESRASGLVEAKLSLPGTRFHSGKQPMLSFVSAFVHCSFQWNLNGRSLQPIASPHHLSSFFWSKVSVNVSVHLLLCNTQIWQVACHFLPPMRVVPHSQLPTTRPSIGLETGEQQKSLICRFGQMCSCSCNTRLIGTVLSDVAKFRVQKQLNELGTWYETDRPYHLAENSDQLGHVQYRWHCLSLGLG